MPTHEDQHVVFNALRLAKASGYKVTKSPTAVCDMLNGIDNAFHRLRQEDDAWCHKVIGEWQDATNYGENDQEGDMGKPSITLEMIPKYAEEIAANLRDEYQVRRSIDRVSNYFGYEEGQKLSEALDEQLRLAKSRYVATETRVKEDDPAVKARALELLNSIM